MDHIQNPSSSRADRKTVEKNRRDEMKALYSKLNSIVPHQFRPREVGPLPDQLEGATNYIKMLQAKLEKMKQKKSCLVGMSSASKSEVEGGENSLPDIEVRVMGCALQASLITGLNCQSIFNGIIRLLHEEGAQIMGATFSLIDNTVFHSIHSMIGEQTAQNDGAAARISERLKKFVYQSIS